MGKPRRLWSRHGNSVLSIGRVVPRSRPLRYRSRRSQRRFPLDQGADVLSECGVSEPNAALRAKLFPDHAAGPAFIERGLDVVLGSHELDPVAATAAFFFGVHELPHALGERFFRGIIGHGVLTLRLRSKQDNSDQCDMKPHKLRTKLLQTAYKAGQCRTNQYVRLCPALYESCIESVRSLCRANEGQDR